MHTNRLNLEVILVPQETEPGGLWVQGPPELQRVFIDIPGNLMRFSPQNNNKSKQRSWEYKLSSRLLAQGREIQFLTPEQQQICQGGVYRYTYKTHTSRHIRCPKPKPAMSLVSGAEQ